MPTPLIRHTWKVVSNGQIVCQVCRQKLQSVAMQLSGGQTVAQVKEKMQEECVARKGGTL